MIDHTYLLGVYLLGRDADKKIIIQRLLLYYNKDRVRIKWNTEEY